MFLNLLAQEIDLSNFNKKISIGEAAIDALIGFCIVFLGIALLVFIVWGVGKIMQGATGKGKAPAEKKAKAEVKKEAAVKLAVPVASASAPAASGNELDDETLAVITAAIAACYAQENRNCGFVVKRIRRM